MKNNKIFLMLLLSVFIFLVAPISYAAVNLTVSSETIDPNSGISEAVITISVDNPAWIAGAAFTVNFDTTALSLVSVASSFFDTFAAQFAGVEGAPTSVVVDDVTYSRPLIVNDVAAGAMIAAARVDGVENETQTLLFTLTFDLSNAALNVTYPIQVVPSVINNTDAGYDEAGEAIPMLVGADSSKTDLTEAFWDINVENVTQGSITLSDTNPPVVNSVSYVDGTHIDVAFSEAVIGADNPANYTVTGGLTVTGVEDLGNNIYRLTLSGEISGDQTYTLTVGTAITDTAGNPLDDDENKNELEFSAYTLGDVNDDGRIDSGDAILILRYSVGLTTLTDVQKRAGNVTAKVNDDDIDSGDAIRILRYSVGLISEL